ncbi:MAG: sugar phosphate isomerase/epimerase [Candidatus Bathyarchaeota archaeon]
MSKPKIGLSTLYCLSEPFTSVIKYLPDLDVNYIEIADEGFHALNLRRVKKLKKIGETNNIEFVIHAPWAGINIATPDPGLRRAVLNRLEKSIVNSKKLECKLWVFHPGSKTGLSHFYPDKDWKLNLESVHILAKVARREGVEIAIENTPEPFPSLMKSVTDFQRFYREFNEKIGMVLDIAHANLNSQIPDFLKQFNKYISHIHLSDNDGTSDLHRGIGYGNIDWTWIAKLVNDAKYNNLLIIESTNHIKESINFLRELFA